MDLSRLLKIIVGVAIVLVVWKTVLPKLKDSHGPDTTVQSSTASRNASPLAGGGQCVAAAQRASEAWGGGISRFANPPYDQNAWASFRSDVDTRIGNADSLCSCSDQACTKSAEALHDLRGLVSEVDGTIRNGAEPPSNLVSRQEEIDNRLNEAHDLVRAGR
ncbi:MAG: hypothetical protein JO197_19745 [Acidobacteria bacterium]|nr:hypothetical protein [Acidobacteriota bacterium]MBV9478593.1 hypothetical protein [Acidobacteriota bacterium]